MKNIKIWLVGTVVLLGLSLGAIARAGDIHYRPHWAQPKAIPAEHSTPTYRSTGPMVCSKCTDAIVVIKHEVATKPGHGLEQVTMKVHQCPNCRNTFARKIGTKEVALVHTCRMENEAPNCCGTGG